jgi:transcription initiation factor TFIIIB Brf1 subunit/transcription initiation factor TFIIB
MPLKDLSQLRLKEIKLQVYLKMSTLLNTNFEEKEVTQPITQRKQRSGSPKTSRPHSYPKSLKQQKDEKIQKLTEIVNVTLNVCKHVERDCINGQNICCECGEHIEDVIDEDQEWRYYGSSDNKNNSDPSRVQYRKNPDKGIRKDLEKLQFSQEVINLADQYYGEVTKGDIKRGNLRKGIMFACVFEAFNALDKYQLPEHLKEIFCIEKKDICKGITYFNKGMPKREKKYLTPEHFIPKLCDKFSLKKDFVDEVVTLYKSVSTNPTLSRSYPQSVSAGCIYYVLKKKNIDISPYDFGKVLNMSEITITKKAHEIEEVLSNLEIAVE